jgi:hypothetical protein
MPAATGPNGFTFRCPLCRNDPFTYGRNGWLLGRDDHPDGIRCGFCYSEFELSDPRIQKAMTNEKYKPIGRSENALRRRF